MNKPTFHNEQTLAEATEALGKQALAQGLIPCFVVRHYPDTKQFCIPSFKDSAPLTPEEAYMHLQKLLNA